MMRGSNIGKIIGAAISAAVIVFLVGCTKDEIIQVGGRLPETGSNLIRFVMGGGSAWTPDKIEGAETRSSSGEYALQCADSSAFGGELMISMVEENIPVAAETPAVATKDGSTPEVTDFGGIYAYEVPYTGEMPQEYNNTADGLSVFMDNYLLKSDGSYTGEIKYWPGPGSYLKFFVFSPYYTPSATPENDIYKVTSNDNQPLITYEVPEDAAKQLDIMGYASGNLSGDHMQELEVGLDHLLSKVQFKVQDIGEGEIVSIGFTGLKYKGTHVIGNVSANGAEWHLENTTLEFVQESPVQNAENILGLPYYFIPQNFPEGDAENGVVASDAAIEIKVKVGDITYPLTCKLNEILPEDCWKSGKQYTFVISTP